MDEEIEMSNYERAKRLLMKLNKGCGRETITLMGMIP